MYLLPSTIHDSMTGLVTYAFISNFILIIGLRTSNNDSANYGYKI